MIIKEMLSTSTDKRVFLLKKVLRMFAGSGKIPTFATAIAEIAQLVEHNLAKVGVASSSLVFRRNRGNSSVGRAQPCQGWGREFESRFPLKCSLFVDAQVAELVDAHVSGACVERHAGSSPVLGTTPYERGDFCGNSSVGRAQPCQGWGREFESRFPLRERERS